MNEPKIVVTKVGYSNAVLLVNGTNSILIDTGVKGYFGQIKNLITNNGLEPSDIKLIILTHVHRDHTGNLKPLIKYTGARVLVHKNEYENLKAGFLKIPRGIGSKTRFISRVGRILWPNFASPKSYPAELVNYDEFDLSAYNINANVISTPGHTQGSQSVLTGKSLIAGDTFIHLKNGTIFPHFVDEPEVLLKTWEKLFQLEIEDIYPGHGKKFKTAHAFYDFEKWKKKLSFHF